jgi:sarcosine oxidase, subunit gamma
MPEAQIAERTAPLTGRMAATAQVSVTPAEPAYRMSLRARPDAVSALSKALGITLPSKPKSSETKATRSALWLGPDEWLVLDSAKNPAADLAKVKTLHSAVDISHRNTAILVNGAAAEATLSAGCPQNLSLRAFPVGASSRTILGKAEIVILRTGPQSFRVETWRSFSDYVMTFLSDAARGAAV